MAADARLCALPHFDLDGGAGAEVILMHAEAAGRDLHDGICAVLVEILMQTALAGVVVDAERFCGAGKEVGEFDLTPRALDEEAPF